MADAEPSSKPAEKEQKPPEGLSQFIGKVLDQLSLSAWMPAAMLVGCGAVLLQLRSRGDFNLGKAVVDLTNKPLGILVVLLFALVLAALVSQAFSFSAIRFFEGYWKGPLVWLGVYRLMVRRKARKRAKLAKKLADETQEAFGTAVLRMLTREFEPSFIRAVAEAFYSEDEPTTLEKKRAAAFNWQALLSPDTTSKLSRIKQAKEDYPAAHRTLPTKLGNILRATEDSITNKDQETQGLVLQRGDAIPARLRLHHDQFRTRLDMYCTLVFVYLGLAGFTVALLVPAQNSPIGIVVITSAFLLLAIASYSAAITSARGYCTTLKVIFPARAS
ncbi:hypothetical protein [Amycolatopsis sp. MEPSY49]|uniref:hypothetical protein n=1 Tax=Amycolatopsis sp. MEPSY49 TaxID=3151600 RepID=UPI003EF85098